ncbi:DUF6624 domain-containing protein [Streptomyces sp. JJ38]|uniref:DUF6624 domain-containing protein n=1 Tax=Streptomyces sp. JJ38 TaxID=2738128 RepID=UPI001C56D1D8|nr:DUF6624 domain-containing protein [Streptomyces sp. JJ38]MBW1597209.1 hypothetical protein [Streptomyces sp. JJ38]
MTTAPLRPDLARELLDRADQAATGWVRFVRDQRDALQLGSRDADHAGAKILRRILADHDWPGQRLVGPDGARAAWQLALHADHDPDFQRVAARLLHRAAQAGDASVQHWAHLHDRALINSGHTQVFGTQYRATADGIETHPVREPAGLDTRRVRVGLPPAATALAALRTRLSTTPIRSGIGDTVVLTSLAGAA